MKTLFVSLGIYLSGESAGMFMSGCACWREFQWTHGLLVNHEKLNSQSTAVPLKASKSTRIATSSSCRAEEDFQAALRPQLLLD
jgi:hypothetical protein